jgi:hypothetical protein
MRFDHLLIAPVLVLSALAASSLASAQTGTGCSDIEFSSTITDRFPNAADACHGIETRDGVQYAHFKAEIVGVSGNRLRARFLRPDGEYGKTYSMDVDPSARVEIGGRKYRYRDLAAGQELDIYLPPNRWQFHVPETEDFGAETTTVVILYPVVGEEPTMAATELPATASPLPALGLAGGLLLLIGGALTAIRWRQPKP